MLQQINDWMPPALKARYSELVRKRQAEVLAEPEYDELQELTDRVELLEAERVKHLGELARVRKTSLSALMRDLGLSGSHRG